MAMSMYQREEMQTRIDNYLRDISEFADTLNSGPLDHFSDDELEELHEVLHIVDQIIMG